MLVICHLVLCGAALAAGAPAQTITGVGYNKDIKKPILPDCPSPPCCKCRTT
jgi:hypothetical protein